MHIYLGINNWTCFGVSALWLYLLSQSLTILNQVVYIWLTLLPILADQGVNAGHKLEFLVQGNQQYRLWFTAPVLHSSKWIHSMLGWLIFFLLLKTIQDFYLSAKWIITLSTLIFIMQKYSEFNSFCWTGKTIYSTASLFFIKFCIRAESVQKLINKGFWISTSQRYEQFEILK